MAGVQGYAGNFKIGTNAVGDISKWSADIELNTEDDSAFGDGWEEPAYTQGKWSGQAEGRWNMSDTYQTSLQNSVLNKSTATLRLYTNASNYYSGTCLIQKLSTGAEVSGLVPVSFSFLGVGAPSYA